MDGWKGKITKLLPLYRACKYYFAVKKCFSIELKLNLKINDLDLYIVDKHN